MQSITKRLSQIIDKNARWGDFAQPNRSTYKASGLDASPLSKEEQIIVICITLRLFCI